jgi:hypothetical protein
MALAMPDRPWKAEERAAAALFGGRRLAENAGGTLGFEADGIVGQVKHVGRLSLVQLEELALESERLGGETSKAGLLVVKRRAGAGHETPRLIVMTELAWRQMSRSDEDESEAESPTQNSIGTAEPEQSPVARPTPTAVKETVRSLGAAGATVSVAMIVRELRRRTGCSRAGAYRALRDAFAADAITRT